MHQYKDYIKTSKERLITVASNSTNKEKKKKKQQHKRTKMKQTN